MAPALGTLPSAPVRRGVNKRINSDADGRKRLEGLVSGLGSLLCFSSAFRRSRSSAATPCCCCSSKRWPNCSSCLCCCSRASCSWCCCCSSIMLTSFRPSVPPAPAVWQMLLWHPTPDTNCSVCPSFQLFFTTPTLALSKTQN